VTKAADVTAALEPYLGRISVVVHNAQVFLNKPFDQIDEAQFEAVWRVTCLGAMTVARLSSWTHELDLRPYAERF
jgi:NAD(P)-dependent dehydrogenase (short-subunit alcohol dehydrogenase family)